MKSKISTIIRTPEDDIKFGVFEDSLNDVIDETFVSEEGVEYIEQVAVITRSFPTVQEAQDNDGKIVDEDFDATDFLAARALAEAESLENEAIHDALKAVDNNVTAYQYKLSGWLLDNFTVPPSDFAFIDSATTIDDVKTALAGILNKIALSASAIEFLEDQRTKYENWHG